MPCRVRPIACRWSLPAAYDAARLTARLLTAAVQAMVSGTHWRAPGLPVPGPVPLSAPAWCMLGRPLMALPVAGASQPAKRGQR